jgi:predicted ArsR family transcriptional regulator
MSQYPQLPGWKEPTTSREAALAISVDAKNLRDRVFKLLQSLAPDEDLTADQIAIRLQRSPLSVRPRVSELAAAGKVQRTGNRSKNESGMTAHRWRAT